MEIKEIVNIVNESGIVFLTYGGMFTQSLVDGLVDVLENKEKDTNLTLKTKLLVVFIEIAQNIQQYTKSNKDFDLKALIVVIKKDNTYKVISKNIIKKEDKEYLEKILNEINSISKEEIKQKYKEIRKSKKLQQDNSAGIGFYEIARKCDKIEYNFEPIDNNFHEFTLKITIKG